MQYTIFSYTLLLFYILCKLFNICLASESYTKNHQLSLFKGSIATFFFTLLCQTGFGMVFFSISFIIDRENLEILSEFTKLVV